MNNERMEENPWDFGVVAGGLDQPMAAIEGEVTSPKARMERLEARQD